MRFSTVFLLTIVVCCTIKVHAAPLQKRDVEPVSEKETSGIDNLKQKASSTFTNLTGQKNVGTAAKWIGGVNSKWPTQAKANGGKPNTKPTSNKKLKEKATQLDEDGMTGNLFDETETVVETEQEGSEVPIEEAVDEIIQNDKKKKTNKKKKGNTRKQPTMVPLYYGDLLGDPLLDYGYGYYGYF